MNKATVMEKATDARTDDLGNILSMEHVNLWVTDVITAANFYLVGLGFTRDPFMVVGPENMWVNVGDQQFHLPTRGTSQVIPGHVGLVVGDLAKLEQRLEGVRPKLASTKFSWSREKDHVAVTCPWGNEFRCYAPSQRFGGVQIGIPYVEFQVRAGTAPGIVRFYQQIMGAPATLKKAAGGASAVVQVGLHQSLIFRETSDAIRPYDGHHIAVYVANFSGAYEFFKKRDALLQDIVNHQYRFKDILDPETGEKLHDLEHEVRSAYHPMWKRNLVNRDPALSMANYGRGAEAVMTR